MRSGLRKRPPASTAEWRSIARGPDVLYHVLTWPEKRGSWTEEGFYGAGASDWEDFRRHWRQYDESLGGTCVEIGCGVGRMTRALAGDFERVFAIDVAEEMIERARKVVPDNVDFHQTSGAEIPLEDGSADAVFSVHVLQHLENMELVLGYLSEARRVLRPGGTVMVHLPVGERAPLAKRLRQEVRLRRSRRRQKAGEEPTSVRMRAYPMADVYRSFDRLRFEDIQLRVFAVRSNGYPHVFWLATAS